MTDRPLTHEERRTLADILGESRELMNSLASSLTCILQNDREQARKQLEHYTKKEKPWSERLLALHHSLKTD